MTTTVVVTTDEGIGGRRSVLYSTSMYGALGPDLNRHVDPEVGQNTVATPLSEPESVVPISATQCAPNLTGEDRQRIASGGR